MEEPVITRLTRDGRVLAGVVKTPASALKRRKGRPYSWAIYLGHTGPMDEAVIELRDLESRLPFEVLCVRESTRIVAFPLEIKLKIPGDISQDEAIAVLQTAGLL